MATALRCAFAACLFAIIIVSGCACNGGPSVRGSGVTAKETRNVSGFTDVRANGSGEIVIRQADADSLVVEAEDNILPELESTVANGILTVGPRRGVSLRPTRPIRYQVTVKKLTGVGFSGAGTIRATGVDTDKLDADISGSGSAVLEGRAGEVTLSVAGSGSYDASNLKATTVRVTISGSGNASVDATEKLHANISGSGSVRYAGNPTVEKNVSGSGSVARR